MYYIKKTLLLLFSVNLSLTPVHAQTRSTLAPFKNYGSMVYKNIKPVAAGTGRVAAKSSISLAASIFMITIFSAIERAKNSQQNLVDIDKNEAESSLKNYLEQQLSFLLDGELFFSLIGSSLITSGAINTNQFITSKFKSEVKKKDSVVRKFLKGGVLSTIAIFSWQFSSELFKLASQQLTPEDSFYANQLGHYLLQLNKNTLEKKEQVAAKKAISNLFSQMIHILSSNNELTSLLFYNTLRRGLSSDVIVMSLAAALGNITGSYIPVVGNTLGTILGLGLGVGYAFLPYKNKIHVETAFSTSKIFVSKSKLRNQFYRLKVFVNEEYKKGLKEGNNYHGFKNLDRNLPRIEKLVQQKLKKFKTRRQRYLDSLLSKIFNLNNLYSEVKNSKGESNTYEYEQKTKPEYVFSKLKLTIIEIRDLYNDIFYEYMNFKRDSLTEIKTHLDRNSQYNNNEKDQFIKRFENLFREDFSLLSNVIEKFDYLLELTREPEYRDAIIDLFVEIYMTNYSENTFIEI